MEDGSRLKREFTLFAAAIKPPNAVATMNPSVGLSTLSHDLLRTSQTVFTVELNRREARVTAEYG